MSTLDAVKNFSIAEVSTGYSDVDVTIELASGLGDKFPTPLTDGEFNLVWFNSTDYSNPSDDPNVEIVRCTARTGDILTIERGQEDTIASAKNTSLCIYKVLLGPTAKTITDIQTELDNNNLQKVTDRGSTTTNKITLPAVQFDIEATPQPNAEGLMQWNNTDGTLDLGMDGGDITMQIGQEMFTKVRNQSGSTILNGKAVYFSGRLGNRPLISLALGDAEVTSRVAGITTQDITSPNDGFITTVGYVRGIKTDYTGAGDWGTTWVEGDLLYVSKTVAGQITNVEPDIPHHSDIIGSVGIVHSSLGSILISIERHKALEGLSDVNGTAPIEGSILSYHDGVGEQYFDFTANITDFLSKTITISNPTVMTSTPIISVPNASTITSIKVLCIGGTSITGNVDVLDNNGNSPTPVNADVTAVAGTESTYTSFASPTVASGYYIGWHTTSISGVPSKVIISVTYTLN